MGSSSISSADASDISDRPTPRPRQLTLGTDPSNRLSVSVAAQAAAPLDGPGDQQATVGVRRRQPAMQIGLQRDEDSSVAGPSTTGLQLPIPRPARRQVSSTLLSSSGRESWRYQTLPIPSHPPSNASRGGSSGPEGSERNALHDNDLGNLGTWASLAELQGPLSPSQPLHSPLLSGATRPYQDHGATRRDLFRSSTSDAGDSSFGPSFASVVRSRLSFARNSVTSSGAPSLRDDGNSLGGGGIDIERQRSTRHSEDAHLRQIVSSPGSIVGAGPLASSTPVEGSSISQSHSMDFSRFSISESVEENSEEAEEVLDDERRSVSPSATARPPAGDKRQSAFHAPDSSTERSPTTPFSPIPPTILLQPSNLNSAPPSNIIAPQLPPTLPRWKRPLIGFSRQQIDVLKCSLAYTLASLFTFSPFLNSFLLGNSSAHTIATVSVYYNPAKSLGTMLEADIFCLIVAAIAAFVSLAAVGTLRVADTFNKSWDRDFGDWTALFFWFGGTLSVLAWLKVRLGKQSFNSATSMGVVILSNVIVKEGGLRKLLEVLLNVAIGTSISNLICFSIYPHRATAKLQKEINTTLTSFSTLLLILSQTFLLDSSTASSPAQDLSAAVLSHEKSFTALKKTLSDAKSEFLGAEQGERFEVVVTSLTRLAQHLTGLRSGTGLQYELMSAARDGRIVVDQHLEHQVGGRASWSPQEVKEGSGFFEAATITTTAPVGDKAEDERLANEANLFSEVREHVGPQLRTLTEACKSALLAVRETFNEPHGKSTDSSPCDFYQITQDLEAALRDFQAASSESIADIYGEVGEGNARPKDSVFLVFYFIFTLDEFAREVLFLLGNMEDTLHQQNSVSRGWKYLWKKVRRSAPSQTRRPRQPRRTLRKRMSTIIPIDPSEFLKPTTFPRKGELAPNTATNPLASMLSLKPRLYHKCWEFLERCKKNDIKYAVKVGMATPLLAAPAFSDTWRQTFLDWKMEWSLIAFFATMSPTEGATNAASVFRVLGTLAGAAVAAAVYSLFPENNVVLPLVGFFVSLPCFWVIVTMPFYAASGRFVLLTYNLTALYSYNSRANDIPVLSIAYRRFISVSIGTIFTLIVSRALWPYAARKELLSGISDFYIDLSFLYTRLLATFSSSERVPTPSSSTPVDASWEEEPSSETTKLLAATTADPLSASVREFMAMELHLQLSLLELKGLLEAATREPRLKGPFPKKLFNAVLLSSQTILDRFHSIRCVVNREDWNASLYKSHIAPVNAERREMVGNVMLAFTTISAGFKLKAPMPPYLPPAERARQRLLRKAEKLALVQVPGSGSRHLLFFSYVLAMAGVIKELDYIGSVLQDAYGVVGGGVAEFEDLFANPAGDSSSDEEDDTLG